MNDSYHIEELEIRISNYLSGNCTEEEKEALFAYLASNEDAAKNFPGDVRSMGCFFCACICQSRGC